MGAPIKGKGLIHHIVLVGLPGSGKSTVGPLVAQELGARFRDLDREIEAREGRTIADIFRRDGEPVFRDLEREMMSVALAGEPTVIAPGGGWAAQPGSFESLDSMVITVYLEVSAATAVDRIGHPSDRPLLQVPAPEARMEALLRERESCYARCDARVRTDDRTPAEVAREVVALARVRAVG